MMSPTFGNNNDDNDDEGKGIGVLGLSGLVMMGAGGNDHIYSKSGGYWAGNSSNYLEFSAENAKSSSNFFRFVW